MVVWGPLRTFLLIWSAHDPRQIPAIGLYNVHWPLAVLLAMLIGLQPWIGLYDPRSLFLLAI